MANQPVNFNAFPDGGELISNDKLLALRNDTILYLVTYNGTATTTLLAGEDILAGDALSLSVSGTVIKAFNSGNLQNATCIGFATSNTSVGAAVPITSLGPLAYTQLTLSPSAIYYLSATPGALTNTPPTNSGSYKTAVAIGLTSSTLLVNLGYPTLLA